MRQFASFGLLWLVLLASGCAGLTVEPVCYEAKKEDPACGEVTKDADARGFRYYDTAPFLLVYTNNKGGLTSKVYYLPDMTKKRSIRPYNYLASNNTTLKFEDGKLTSAKAVVDETIIPSAVISALEKVASSAIKAANAGSDVIPGPYLFRIVKAKDGWTLAGGQAIGTDGEPAKIRYLPKQGDSR